MQPYSVVAETLTHIDGFTQSAPLDDGAGLEKTQSWTGRTSSAIYFARLSVVFARNLPRRHQADY